MQTYARENQQPHGSCTIELLITAIQPLEPKAVRPIERICRQSTYCSAKRSAAQLRVADHSSACRSVSAACAHYSQSVRRALNSACVMLRIGASARTLQRMLAADTERAVAPHGKARLCVRTRREGAGGRFRV